MANMEATKTIGDAVGNMKATSWLRQLSDASTAASEEGSCDEGSGKSISTNVGVFDWMTHVETDLSSGIIDSAKSGLPATCTLPETCQPETLQEILELPTAAF